MYDQANELRQLVGQRMLSPGRSSGGAKLLVVAGGKGGVGTTTIALHLSVALARESFRPLLVDADVNGGNTALLCDIHERYTIADVLAGRKTVQEALEVGPEGIRVLAGDWELAVLAEGATTAQQWLIGQLRGSNSLADVVIVDVGNSWTRWARRLWQAADAVLLVTTPELPAIMDAYAAVKVMAAGEPSIPLELVVNRASDATVAADVESRLTKASQRFLGVQLHFAGHMPEDKPNGEGNNREESLHLTRAVSPWTRQLARLADNVAKRTGLTHGRRLSAAG